MDSQSPRDAPTAEGKARTGDGIGSSGGRVLAALRRTQAIEEGHSASADQDTDEREFARLERIYRERREREKMFEQQARALEALLGE